MNARLFLDGFLTGPTWAAWRAVGAALTGQAPESDEELALFRTLTGRTTWPTAPAREGWVIVGRRGGKTRFAATLAVMAATGGDYRAVLAPGERGVLMLIAADRRQARVALRYVSGMLRSLEAVAKRKQRDRYEPMIENETKDSIDLTNGITIEVHTASFRSVRGFSCVGAIADELAFWPTEESANPDAEILAALRPAMSTVPGALLLCISSPYARRGELYRVYREHYGRDDSPVLVIKASSQQMNPSLSAEFIAAQFDEDPARAAAEYGAEFRSDIEAWISREAVETCTMPERHELPRQANTRYVAFVDPSGGSADSMTLAIAHGESRGEVRVGILDALREVRPPFSPESAVSEFAETLAGYGVTSVHGDRYGGEWPADKFRQYGIAYETSELTKSELYRELLPLVNSGRVELLDERRLLTQLVGLERRTSRGGRDSVDHAPGGHDDVANVAAGALVRAARAELAGAGFFSVSAHAERFARFDRTLDRLRARREGFGRSIVAPSLRDVEKDA